MKMETETLPKMVRKTRKPMTERQAYEHASTALLLFGVSLGLLICGAWIGMGQTPNALDFVGGGIASLFVGSLLAHRLPKGWRMKKYFSTDKEAVSPVIAVILMVAITVVLAATVFVLVSDIGGQVQDAAPTVMFTEDRTAGNLTVTQASPNLVWSAFEVTGCTTVPTGSVDAGDRISDCAGDVTVRHKESNSLTYRGTF